MIGMIKKEYKELIQQGYNVVPLIAKWDNIADLADIYEAFCPDPEQGGLLESGRAGKYSYVAFSPLDKIRSRHGEKGNDPLLALKALMNKWKAPRVEHGPDWLGGALGLLSYDLVQHLEDMPDHAHDDLQLPDLLFTVYRDVVAIAHNEKACYLITNVMADDADDYEQGMERIRSMMEKMDSLVGKLGAEPVHTDLSVQELEISPSFSKEQFEQAVLKVQEYIRSGDVFQVNLSVRQDFSLSATPWEIYKTLRRVNPSPYMGYLHYPDFQVVSGSPELLIKLQGFKLSTRPIAGTRPRGKDREEDLRLANELIGNEKERAEHIMLVDLERNDLGRVCKFGTVHVTDLMVIEEYSHVMHIVSHVEGELEEGRSGYDAIRACFPGGTITGAPKIRTMEIIEELEPVKRGLYTGSIGWIGFNGDLELNIVIRTLVAKNDRGHVQAGAGIVIDSKPEAEYYESLKKAEALLKAVQLSKEKKKLSRV
ncbi:aminodeoxychorismate synthase, component I [Ammoniphilus sp. 3BR4]|uniref:aminodeoxychorismate synthase, component I n=1 Tax=Ammoniphilus sp. 3BR4 TaxID=3158265 RepID=UPI0034660EB4